MAGHLVPPEAVASGEGLATRFASEGWGKMLGAVPEEDLLAGERLVAGGARHWVLVHLHMVVVQLVLGGKDLITGVAGESYERG